MKKNKTVEFLEQAFITQTKGYVDVSQKRDCWTEFAVKNNGKLNIKRTVANDLVSYAIKFNEKHGSIEFRESDTQPLRITCKIPGARDISFSVFREDFWERAMKYFGGQDIILGHPEFDEKYVVKGVDAETVKQILRNEQMLQLFVKTNPYSLFCQYNAKSEVTEIVCQLGRSVYSADGLQDLYELFRILVCEIGNIKYR